MSDYPFPHIYTDGSDYEVGQFTVSFPAGVNVATFIVPISDDKFAECEESFTMDLEIPSAATEVGVIKGAIHTATVHIKDNDGG